MSEDDGDLIIIGASLLLSDVKFDFDCHENTTYQVFDSSVLHNTILGKWGCGLLEEVSCLLANDYV